jgi:hypothetical protein
MAQVPGFPAHTSPNSRPLLSFSSQIVLSEFSPLSDGPFGAKGAIVVVAIFSSFREGANKRGNSSRLTQSFHFFMFEPIFSPVNALNQPI